jgi:transposase
MSKDASSTLPSDPNLLARMLRESQELVTQLQSQLATKELELQLQAEAHQQKQAQLERRIAELLKQFFAKRRERFVHPDQLMLFDLDELTELVQEAQQQAQEEALLARRRGKPKGHGRRALPDHLPREVIRHELPPEELPCPCCGTPRSEIGCETSQQLEFIPAQLKVLVHERVKYACKACQEQVIVAPVPGKPIEKGLPGPGLLAQVVLSKYGDHTPLYRQEDILARSGVMLRRSTLCDWVASASELLTPLYLLLIRRVLQSKVIHTDDTTVKLLDPEKENSITARFWAYLGDTQNPYVVYDFTDSRRRDGPQNFLTGFAGYLQADAYGGYDGIYLGGQVKEVACWAHARRKWFEAEATDSARAHHALALIQRLYLIERDCAQMNAPARLEARQLHSLPILQEFKVWLDGEQEKLLPKSPAGQAAQYARNQWGALTRYCEDGDLAIDNNAAERMMKPCAIGRKNWLFVASREGGRRAAVLMSFVNTCKRNQVEPWAYLRDLFVELTKLGGTPIDEHLEKLLPDRWLQSHPESRWAINDLRKTSAEG